MQKFTSKPSNTNFKPKATTFHGESYTILHEHIPTLKKGVYRLVELGVIKIFETEPE